MRTRRLFLKESGISLAGFATAPPFLLRTALAQKTVVTGKDRPVLIAVFQRGAADGVSMAVPFGDKHYHAARPQIAIDQPIDLDGFFGLHPALASLKPIYDEGHLGVVHAVGSPNHTRSHFDAQDYMESGAPGNKGVADGWLNRTLIRKPDYDASAFRAVSFTSTTPRSLMGPAPVVSMTRISDFSILGGTATAEAAIVFQKMYPETFAAVSMLRQANPQQYSPARGIQYPGTPFGQAMLQIAQLIKADVGLEVAFAELGGWDTHANQGATEGQLAARLREFGDSLAALYRDLGDRMRNVVLLTMTEFGRSIRQNGSGGTDHGHASCSLVLGGPVKGGKVYGDWPGLAKDQLFEQRDLAITTDFRDLFAEILARHMNVSDVATVFPGFRPAQVPPNLM